MAVKKCFLLTDRAERFYFCRQDIEEGYILLSDKKVFFADYRYYSAVKEKLALSDFEVKPFSGIDSIKEEIERQGISTLYIDYDFTTLTEYNSYKSFGVKIKNGAELLKRQFSVKSGEEIKNIKKACEISQEALYKTLPFIKKGITEKEVATILEGFMKEKSLGTSFETIVAFGKNSAVPHHETGDTELSDNSVVLIDFGCKVNGYCSDCTRTFFFGKPTEKFLKVYDSVYKANLLAEEKITSGMVGSYADGIARQYLVGEGLGGFFTHSLGHGVGLNIHESPYLSPKSKEKLKNSTVFTVEPGVYIEGEFGVRIEDTVVLKNGKVKRLFTDGKQLIIIN